MKATVLVAALAALSPFAAPAEEKPKVSSPPAQQAAVDPKTGALRPPTPEEAKALAAPLARQAKPEVVTLPDGSRLIRLNGRHLAYIVARRNPGGGVTLDCTRAPEPLPTTPEVRP